MKRTFLLVAFLMALCSPQEACAQKWLKKLGNFAKSVLLDNDNSESSQQSSSYSSNNSSSSQSSSNKSALASAQARVADISASVTDITRFGKNSVRVGFVLSNQGKTNYLPTLKLSTAKFAGMSQALESAYIKEDDREYDCLLDYNSIRDLPINIPAQSKFKGYMIFEGVPKNVTTLEQLNVNLINQVTKDGGTTFDLDINSPIVTKTAVGGSIRELPASNHGESLCTCPDLSLKVNSFRRSGNKVLLSFTLTNIASTIVDFHFNDWIAYDDSGTSYEKTGLALDISTQGNENMYSTNSRFVFEPGASRSYTLTISNVPSSTTLFSLIRIPLPLKDFTFNSGDENIRTEVCIRNAKISSTSR